ncbi:hypothetical protein TNCV_2102131 [Trichonephila clavipes]|nr:hypothetical protein TNCV_2102131 [Trichonephila clavipes]
MVYQNAVNAVHQSAVNAVHQSAVHQSAVHQSAVHQSAVHQSAVNAVHQSAMHQSAVNTEQMDHSLLAHLHGTCTLLDPASLPGIMNIWSTIPPCKCIPTKMYEGTNEWTALQNRCVISKVHREEKASGESSLCMSEKKKKWLRKSGQE